MRRKSRMKSMAFIVLILFILAGGAAGWFLSRPMFGRLPRGERLRRVEASANYRNGEFVNREPKPFMAEGAGPLRLGWDFLFKKKEHSRPPLPLPTARTPFSSLAPEEDVLLWLGHSSLYMHFGGKRFLVDPNFTSYASPFTWRTYSFDGTDVYTVADAPEVEYLLITHDHFDHLNYDTIKAVEDKVGKVVCGLGVGEHLEYWGVPAEKIIEVDWDESVELDGVTLHALATHHFSGRTLWKRNPTLWVSFALEARGRRVFLGGDSGYGSHFAAMGKRFGGFDLVLLENGQYDPNWRHNHMTPEEAFQAAREMGAKRLLPIHAGRFVLSNHSWDDPYVRIARAAEGQDEVELLTPKIGEPVFLDGRGQDFGRWWEGIGG